MRPLYRFLLISASAFIFSLGATAQSNHTVTVTNFQFTPATVAIEQGDTVTWINTEGFHNVNGDQETYPSNPASFNSGSPGTGWTYQHVFDTPGSYDYRCDVHPEQMQGVVEVGIDAVGTADTEVLTLYPNPASDYVEINGIAPGVSNDQFVVHDITGKKILDQKLKFNERIDVSKLQSGVYFYSICRAEAKLKSGKLVIQ